jgi:hypothetical protein
MGSAQEDQTGPRLFREVDQQCRMRDANEVVERLNSALIACAERLAFRCECGDPDCQARLSLTRTEYEGVREYGSHFAVNVDHENPENACVLSENARYAVIDVVGGDDRYQVLAQNPRHDWVEARDGRT